MGCGCKKKTVTENKPKVTTTKTTTEKKATK